MIEERNEPKYFLKKTALNTIALKARNDTLGQALFRRFVKHRVYSESGDKPGRMDRFLQRRFRGSYKTFQFDLFQVDAIS